MTELVLKLGLSDSGVQALVHPIPSTAHPHHTSTSQWPPLESPCESGTERTRGLAETDSVLLAPYTRIQTARGHRQR